MNAQLAREKKEAILPHKIEFRSRLIQQMREAGVAEAQEIASGDSKEIG